MVFVVSRLAHRYRNCSEEGKEMAAVFGSSYVSPYVVAGIPERKKIS